MYIYKLKTEEFVKGWVAHGSGEGSVVFSQTFRPKQTCIRTCMYRFLCFVYIEIKHRFYI